jgi:hypothetical protein
MNRSAVGTCLFLAGSIAGAALYKAAPILGASDGASAAAPASWNLPSAVRYLDARELWWQAWPPAQKDQGTLCISCHTQLPYALVRPALRRQLGESALAIPENIMMDSVEKRVSNWSQMVPFYSDAKNGPGKTAEAHATEAVLNAIMLASYDNRAGHLRPITRTAFDRAWALQQNTGTLAGGWMWQNFHLSPWEAPESSYQGAALLLMTAINAPDGYARDPVIRPHLDRLRNYLRREYTAQPTINRLYILWASGKDPALLTAVQRAALLAEIRTQQQPDGGWRTSAIDPRERIDHSPEPPDSDGYATGLVVLALEESATPHRDPTLAHGVAWLSAHQQKDGTWTAFSINNERDPETDAAAFMTDAATAYAVLALEMARWPAPVN